MFYDWKRCCGYVVVCATAIGEMNIHDIEILAAARKLAQKMEIENCRGSNGWKKQFCN